MVKSEFGKSLMFAMAFIAMICLVFGDSAKAGSSASCSGAPVAASCSAPEAVASCSGVARTKLFGTPIRSGFSKLRANREESRAVRQSARSSCSGIQVTVKASCSGS